MIKLWNEIKNKETNDDTDITMEELLKKLNCSRGKA